MIPDAPDNTNEPRPPTEGRGLEKIAQKGRVEFRMVKDDQAVSPEIRQRTIDDLKAWRGDNPSGGKMLPWARIAEQIGVPTTTLSEVVAGKYKGDADPTIRKIDIFLADDRARRGRFDFRTNAMLSFTETVFGVIQSGIRMNTMPVIVASSGVGKSQHARAFALHRGAGVYVIRIDEANCNASGVTKLICTAIENLRQHFQKTHSDRLAAIKEYLRTHGSTVLIIDECQKLSGSGLEMLRDIHDISDLTTHRNVPIVFFGDQNFLKLIFAGRSGSRSPISPQCIRRMRPVLNIDTSRFTQQPDGGIYSVQDIVNIVRNNRVKLLTPKATRWLRDLANVIPYGALGNAMGVLQQAVDLVVTPGGELPEDTQIDVDTLQEALEMTFGNEVAVEIDQMADGALLRRATA
jgi:hypothetical protein